MQKHQIPGLSPPFWTIPREMMTSRAVREGIVVSELGWPSTTLRRVVSGLGWPIGQHDVSRETTRTLDAHGAVVAAANKATAEGDAKVVDITAVETADDRPSVSLPLESPVPVTSGAMTSAEGAGTVPTVADIPTVISGAPHEDNLMVTPRAAVEEAVPVQEQQESTDSDVRLEAHAPTEPVDTPVEVSPDTVRNSSALPAGLAQASEALGRELAHASSDPDSRSVSVNRPWLEVEPNPALVSHLMPTDSTSTAAAAALPAATSPIVESIAVMDESTPLAMEVAQDTRRRIALAGRRFPRPRRTRVMTVANQKGGVGKTTTTVNMAAALAQAGLRVLVLDIDPQGNASTALGIDHHAEVPSIYDVLVEGRPLAEVVQTCPHIEGLWCAPATIDLAGAEIELVSLVARESRLKRAVTDFLDQAGDTPERLDYILIDCPPSLGLLTVNAFVAAREVLIPIQCEYYALEGLSQLLRNVELIRGHLNPALHVSTILLTMYDGRTRLSSQVADEVRAHFPSEVLRTTVPRSVRISEAPSHGQTVMTYDPASSGALSYLEAARELAEQVLNGDGSDQHTTEGTA